MNWSLSIALALMSAAEEGDLTPEQQPAALVEEAQETFESFELMLTDGQILEGRSLERIGDSFHLGLRSGRTLVMPVDSVKEMRLRRIGKEEPPSGLRYVTEGEVLPGSSGDGKFPGTAEQLAELPPAAEFQESIIDPAWQPNSDWDNDQAQNEFNPTRWADSIVDPNWTPTPAYTLETDVTYFNPVRWSKSPIDSRWTPQDGFAKKKAFWEAPAESYVVPDPPPEGSAGTRGDSQNAERRPLSSGSASSADRTSAETQANPEKSPSPRSN